MLSLSYNVFLKMIIGKQSNIFLGELGAISLNKVFGKKILLQGNWFYFSKASMNTFILVELGYICFGETYGK
jgi:hypothetical protein